MKKKTVMNIALLLIPLAVVAVAVAPNSVMIIQNGETVYTSFSTVVEGSNLGWCTPVALLLTYALFGMGVLYGLNKKELWLKLIRTGAFVTASLAALPIVVQDEIIIAPSALAMILLLVLWAVANYGLKNQDTQSTEKPKGRRLSNR